MKKIYLWHVATILLCSLVLNSCTDLLSVPDNHATDSEGSSVVDKGKWWLDESYMDKTVKPGDNFYMYCVGSWWKNTSLGNYILLAALKM